MKRAQWPTVIRLPVGTAGGWPEPDRKGEEADET